MVCFSGDCVNRCGKCVGSCQVGARWLSYLIGRHPTRWATIMITATPRPLANYVGRGYDSRRDTDAKAYRAADRELMTNLLPLKLTPLD